MMIKRLYLDLETTGVDRRIHGIHQISGVIEFDEEIQEEFDFKVQPHPKAKVEAEALKVCGKSELDLLGYPPMKEVHGDLLRLLGKYVNKFDKKDKFHLIGYNLLYFDNPFLRDWFKQNGDVFFGSWFFTGPIDVMALAAEYLTDRRPQMPSFKLHRVARTIGLHIDENRLHDAMYDVQLTRQIYKIVTKIDMEL